MISTIKPLKRFSQNFLQDRNIARKIVESMQIRPGDHVTEIGPGQGMLTEFLLNTELAKLSVIEMDERLIPLLNDKFGSDSRFSCIHADFLKTDLQLLLREDNEQFRLIGNLPYGITSPILFHVMDHYRIVSDATFMMQKEVGERLVSGPDCKAYGIPSVLFQAVYQMKTLFRIPPEAFHPVPEVESVIVQFIRPEYPIYPLNDWSTLQKLVRTAFGQRRKMLRKSLSAWNLEIMPDLPDLSRRPENLSIKEWVDFSNKIIKLKYHNEL